MIIDCFLHFVPEGEFVCWFTHFTPTQPICLPENDFESDAMEQEVAGTDGGVAEVVVVQDRAFE